MKDTAALTTYLIEFENGKRQKVTVPSNWKVTFGPAAKGTEHATGRGQKMPLALRFYESDKVQKAIFTDVVGFRDTSIEIQEEVVNVSEKQGYVEYEGKRKKTSFQATTREWVNPDKVDDKPQLPQGTEVYEI